MEITEVETEVSFTKNMGNYESLRLSQRARATVPAGMSYADAKDALYEHVEEKFLADLEALVADVRATLEG